MDPSLKALEVGQNQTSETSKHQEPPAKMGSLLPELGTSAAAAGGKEDGPTPFEVVGLFFVVFSSKHVQHNMHMSKHRSYAHINI